MAKKITKTTKQAASMEAEQDTPHNLLNEFWEKFRLSQNDLENSLLTNMGWLTLISLGPLGLLLLLMFIYALIYYRTTGQNVVLSYTLIDFRDPIFTYISLSMFFGALIFRYRWYPAIPRAFQSLIENDVLRNQDSHKVTEAEFLGFLEEYRRNLHSQKRYTLPVLFALFSLGVSFFVTLSRGGYWQFGNPPNALGVLDFLHQIPRWILAPAIWSYLGMLILWTLFITTKAIMDLTPRFQINVQPLHSDRAGGLKKLGDLCSHIGLLMIVVATPSIVLAIQGIILSTKIAPCGHEIQLFVNGQASMTPERLTDCIYFSNSRFHELSHADISDYMTKQLAEGTPLLELATSYYNTNQGQYQRQAIIANYSTYYAMGITLSIILVIALYAVIRPLFDIHDSMVEYKLKRERETNRQVSNLFDEMTNLMRKNKLEEADKVKSNINFLNTELADIKKYPSWPISSLPVLRSYVTSSFVTALITYAISLLKLTVSTEAGGVLNALIKSVFGQ
jgi:hypothetical protein